MNTFHYIGFDVHKKTISFCVKTAGEIVEEGKVAAERGLLRQWAAARQQKGTPTPDTNELSCDELI
jgi:hypothetical protein